MMYAAAIAAAMGAKYVESMLDAIIPDTPPSDFAAATQKSYRLLQPGISLRTKIRITAQAGSFGLVTSTYARFRNARQLMAGVGSSGSSGSSLPSIEVAYHVPPFSLEGGEAGQELTTGVISQTDPLPPLDWELYT
jgi:hypothetical protein